MNAFLLMTPFFLIRFGLLAFLNKEALKRAALFAPLKEKEKTAYLFYQVSNISILLYSIFLKIKTVIPLFFIGLCIYILGVIVLTISIINFAKPNISGINRNGIYKISRNPMYVSYFFYFLGCVIITRSLILLLILLIFQVSAHWIILSEERWCIDKFGNEYINYMKQVRRYL